MASLLRWRVSGLIKHVMVHCRCWLSASDCQNQLPGNGVYMCTARILGEGGALSTPGDLTLAGAHLHVGGASIELELPVTAELPPSNKGIVYIDL